MSLLAKKTKDLTAGERFSLYSAVGTSGLPYPASHFVAGTDGALEMEIGIIADDDHPLALYADMPHDHVVGLLYREMAIPSLLHVQKEAILRRIPESTNRLMAIFGDPGSGKSHMAKMMGRIRDPRGAEIIDCGGRYMGDLLFEQVIDFGEDFKTALTDRIKSGSLSSRSVKIFDEEFPGALTRDSDEQITGINWDKIGIPKNNGTEKEPKFETTAEAVTRSMGLIENTIAKWESIPTQTVNTVGVRKQAGPLIRAFQEGRELILDEYTKSIDGSDDSLQTVLQFLTGEEDTAFVENSMKVNGREETYAFTFRRTDMKSGFFVTMTGNEEKDGGSTHSLSRSAFDRIDPFVIEDSYTKDDWEHRISQILTGVPLSTLYSVFSDMAQDDPEDFGEMMVELRLMGLDDEQRAKIPAHQLSMLKNWEDTRDAVERLTNLMTYWGRIVDPDSDLYWQKEGQHNADVELRAKTILPEITLQYRDRISMGFRKAIKILDKALTEEPEVRKIDASTSLRLNFGAVGRKLAERTPRPEVIASEFGTRLENVLRERIGTMTAGRPKLQATLMKEARERKVLALSGQDGIAKLLNQDVFAHMGGIKNITLLREVLGKRMRQADSALNGKSDDDLIPLDQAAALCEELSRLAVNDDNPHVGQIVTLGVDATDAFNMVAAVDGIKTNKHEPPKPEASQLVRVSDFLDTLRIPTIAGINMRGIWRKTLSNDNKKAPDGLISLFQIAENTHDIKIGITTLMTQNAKGEAVPTHVMIDGERKKSLIITDADNNEAASALGKNYTVVSYDDKGAEEQVAAFIADTLKHPSRLDQAAELEGQLIGAFMFRSGDVKSIGKLAEMMTRKDIEMQAPVYMMRQPG